MRKKRLYEVVMHQVCQQCILVSADNLRDAIAAVKADYESDDPRIMYEFADQVITRPVPKFCRSMKGWLTPGEKVMAYEKRGKNLEPVEVEVPEESNAHG